MIRKAAALHGLSLYGVSMILGSAGAMAAEPVDLLLVHGKVLTVDSSFSIASALAIKDGRIVAVGGDDLAAKYTAKQTLDLKGRVAMPGFMDTHIHMLPQAHRDIDMPKAHSIADIQDLVRRKAKELGPGEWISGFGWDEFQLGEQRVPHKEDLDKAAPNNPVALYRAGGHSIVGNSLALKLAGITRTTEDPSTGLIEHDDQGEPNGVIRERSDLYTSLIPPEKWQDMRAGYIQALRSLLPLGITSIMEATGTLDDEPVGAGGIANPSSSGVPMMLTYRRLREIYSHYDTGLPRVALYINYPGAERLKQYPHHTGFGDDRVRLGPIGESPVDGGFTGPTAWTLADYKGQPGFRGKGRYTDAQLQELTDTSGKLGWQVGLHCIGDAAIVQTVNAYAKSLATVPKGSLPADPRWFTDHFTIMPPDATMKKMADSGIRIAQQPNFTYTLEGRYAETMDDWRNEHNNPIATPAKKFGLFVAFGSDNLPIDPRVGLYAAVTRKGMSGKIVGAEEAVSIQDAIRMYTANPPYLTWEEKQKGTLQAGKLADLVVLDSDPLTLPPEKLLTMNVDITVVGGKIVYRRPAQ
ncbi:MAG: amidohydrolase [Gammaproteobacteria bacterium]